MLARTMTPQSKHRTRIAVAAVTAVAALGVTAGTAAADDSAAQSSSGHLKAGGIDVTYDAHKAAGAPSTQATGTFVAEGAPIAAMGLPASVGSIRLAGPITCLKTQGENVSFYYKFDKTSTSGILDQLGSGLIVTLKKEGNERKMGFLPMLDGLVGSVGCDSPLAPLYVTSGDFQNGG